MITALDDIAQVHDLAPPILVAVIWILAFPSFLMVMISNLLNRPAVAKMVQSCCGIDCSGDLAAVTIDGSTFTNQMVSSRAASDEMANGATVMVPTDRSIADGMLKSAGQAMQHAKPGQNAVKVVASETDKKFRDRIDLERTLINALSQGRFVLHYQPLFELHGSTLVGFEALIRMVDEGGVLVSPALFIPIADEMGLLDEIGSWALREACATASAWPERLSVAVNLSPTQFGNGRIAQLVSRTLDETGLAPSRLELEITESLLLEDSDSIMAELREIKATGAKIVMDDFGTGYSSLSYLWKFPFDKLKVDRSFMTGLNGAGEQVRTVLRTIIGLGRELNMRVTVEGVETAEQAAFLQSVNGDQVQGYFYSVPLTGADVSILLAQASAKASESTSSADDHRLRAVA